MSLRGEGDLLCSSAPQPEDHFSTPATNHWQAKTRTMRAGAGNPHKRRKQACAFCALGQSTARKRSSQHKGSGEWGNGLTAIGAQGQDLRSVLYAALRFSLSVSVNSVN
jgi:hypothetical protein